MDSAGEGKKVLSLIQSIILVTIAIIAIFVFKTLLRADTSVALLTSAAIVMSLCAIWGVKWTDIEEQIKENFKSMTVPVLILMCVGMLVGVWITAGTIPTMVYYGMKILTPGIFLVMTCLIASVMSVMTGTSWGTVGTIGVALMGVSAGLGVPAAYTAGAITVGAIFGDKLSPLSDTTVLAAAVAEADIMDHIRYTLYTTTPGLLISLLLYAFLGANHNSAEIGGASYALMLETLETTFNLNPLLLLPPIVVLALIAMKKPTVPTFLIGIVTAAVLACLFQESSTNNILSSLAKGYSAPTGVKIVDSILLRGGLSSMFGTIIMVLSAGVFGAPLKASGAVETIIAGIDKAVRNEKQLMICVALLHILLFLIVISYYVSFIIIGNMTRGLYDKHNLKRVNLSRTLEDTGTAIAPLIPWGLSGAYYSSTLGIPVTEFVMFAPITYLSCIFGMAYAITGFRIARIDGVKS